MENMAKMITVGAVVLRNDVGEVLTVRKRGASLFQLPGGKPEAGESMLETVVRETAEEVGVELDPNGWSILVSSQLVPRMNLVIR